MKSLRHKENMQRSPTFTEVPQSHKTGTSSPPTPCKSGRGGPPSRRHVCQRSSSIGQSQTNTPNGQSQHCQQLSVSDENSVAQVSSDDQIDLMIFEDADTQSCKESQPGAGCCLPSRRTANSQRTWASHLTLGSSDGKAWRGLSASRKQTSDPARNSAALVMASSFGLPEIQ